MNSEKKQIEDLRQENRILKEEVSFLIEQIAQKDKFFRIIAHDLKGPMASIVSLSSILTEEQGELFIEERESLSLNLNEASKTMMELLENLLSWSLAQVESFSFNPVLHDAEELRLYTIDINVRVLQLKALEKNIKISTFIPVKLRVLIDRDMTSLIIRNLISNAIKFTSKNGEIKIFVKKVKNFVEISIEDNGIGISKKNVKNIFKIGEKPQTLGTSGETGTGLGLMLCKEFVEKQGGKIWVESEGECKGSKFTFTIPFVE